MTDLKEQAALHNTRERLTIGADQLQELAAEKNGVGVVRVHSNTRYEEYFDLCGFPNGKLVGIFYHKDAPLFRTDSEKASDLASKLMSYVEDFYNLYKKHIEDSILTDEEFHYATFLFTKFDESED